MTRTYAPTCWVPTLRGSRWTPPRDTTRSRVARFPGWPHGNRTHNGSTSAACKAREVGRGDPTCPPPRGLVIHAPRSVPSTGPLRPARGRTRGPLIENARFALSLFLSPLPGCTQVSIISALPADFDRQFDYGCHSRRTCDFDIRSHASFSRARSADSTRDSSGSLFRIA